MLTDRKLTLKPYCTGIELITKWLFGPVIFGTTYKRPFHNPSAWASNSSICITSNRVLSLYAESSSGLLAKATATQ
ncbi:hypothetical protein BC938DRAFT_483188 [Jimgerdemannia flammicorona]|uniref:Uncharacterized protein n=1 Tax=Jimgerdemannia flammicorona TaxID=994334 RepID=A0A433QW38_9FUNG|nr:hypothetical protein BC938DRAFT_483188 [Jimgerdemannia flammicorona]